MVTEIAFLLLIIEYKMLWLAYSTFTSTHALTYSQNDDKFTWLLATTPFSFTLLYRRGREFYLRVFRYLDISFSSSSSNFYVQR